MARIMTQVVGKPTRFEERPGPVSRRRSCSSAPVRPFQSLDVFAEVDQGIYAAEPRMPETTTPTVFRQWCEEMFRPAVGGSS
jgi:hypothetical protein